MEESELLDRAKTYSFDQLPTDRDCFVIPEAEYKVLVAEWCRYYDEPDGQVVAHPNERLSYRWCALKKVGGASYDVNVCITRSHRFHGVLRRLAHKDFVACLYFREYSKRPYIVVSDDWISQIEKNHSSIFAMIDTIGMREFLANEGKVSKERYFLLSEKVDQIADSNKDCVFLSFADSVLIKTNWEAADEKYIETYQPERFIGIVNLIQFAILEALSLKSYAVVSQGVNYIESSDLVRPSGVVNHFSIPSISGPFAEIFAIDDTVRKNIKNGTHNPKSLYLSEALVLSLKTKNGTANGKFEYFDYVPKGLSFWWNRYVPTDFENLRQLVEGVGE